VPGDLTGINRILTIKNGGEIESGTKGNLFYVCRDIIVYSEEREMAKPIELGLVLEGEDARRFQRYLDCPTDTDDGRELIREAAILAREMRL
jgi:hypothetical protein